MSRFLLIGLDGADPALVERWMREGRLPNLSALARRGSLMPCRSTTPCATFPAWTTCVTGVNPGRHGILDFTCMTRGSYAIEFVNSGWRAAPAIWNALSDLGKRVCVLGVPATYPPERVNGVMVSGWDSPVCTAVDRSFVFPESAWDDVKTWRFADFQESDIGPGWHAAALDKLMRGIADKERIALTLLKRERWDFFMAVFGESDTVAHHFWLFHDPNSPRHKPGFEHAIRDVYARLDETVGKLVAAAGNDVTVGVVSDHGFGGSGTGVVHLNNWLAERGHLAFARERGGLLKRAAMALTPGAWRGPLFRRFQSLATRAESASRFSGIDWSRTKAWSEELNYFPSVRINLRGREPQGQVEPRDYDAFARELCTELESWDAVAKAWRRDELYDGPHADRAPDILLELALEDGYSHSCLRARGGPAFRRLRPEEHLGGKERGMTGNHRLVGVFMVSEPVDARECSLLDVAPTVYDVLGVAGPATEGVSLMSSRVDRRGRTGETPAPPSGSPSRHVAQVAAPYTPEEAAAVESRLRDLGYFE
jgi:predicted AlkP superfamily phosphohydrolase/phosphomutase